MGHLYRYMAGRRSVLFIWRRTCDDEIDSMCLPIRFTVRVDIVQVLLTDEVNTEICKHV